MALLQRYRSVVAAQFDARPLLLRRVGAGVATGLAVAGPGDEIGGLRQDFLASARSPFNTWLWTICTQSQAAKGVPA